MSTVLKERLEKRKQVKKRLEKRKQVSFPAQWSKVFSVVTRKRIIRFAHEIQDENYLHHDNYRTQKDGFRDIFSTGVMVMGFVSSAMSADGVTVYKIEATFKKPLYSGECPTVTCTVLKRKKISVKIKFVVQNSLCEVLVEGVCTLVLPKAS